jgi:hypothetical protein
MTNLHQLSLLAQIDDGGGGPGPVVLLILVAITLVVLAGAWKINTKAGQPGWAVLIPIFNMYIVLKVAGRPGWWLILTFIPIVNLVVLVIPFDVAKRFGKGVLFGLGLLFLGVIFCPILGFGDAQYTPAPEA